MTNCHLSGLRIRSFQRQAGLSQCFVKFGLCNEAGGLVVPAGTVSVKMRQRWERRCVIGLIKFGHCSFRVRGSKRLWIVRPVGAGTVATITFRGMFYLLDFGPVRVSAGTETVDVQLPLATDRAAFHYVGSDCGGSLLLSPGGDSLFNIKSETDQIFQNPECIERIPDGSREAIIAGMLSLLLFTPWIRSD